MATFTNVDSLHGKIIAGPAGDRDMMNLAWIVSDSHSPNLVDIAQYLRRFNGKSVRITIECDVTLD